MSTRRRNRLCGNPGIQRAGRSRGNHQQLRRRRYLTDHSGLACRHHAVLDVMNDNGQIIDTIWVPNRAAFDHLREALSLRVTDSDCDRGCN